MVIAHRLDANAEPLLDEVVQQQRRHERETYRWQRLDDLVQLNELEQPANSVERRHGAEPCELMFVHSPKLFRPSPIWQLADRLEPEAVAD